MEQLQTLIKLCMDDLIFLKYRIKNKKTKIKYECNKSHIIDLIYATIDDIKQFKSNKKDNLNDIVKQIEAISFSLEAHIPSSFNNLIKHNVTLKKRDNMNELKDDSKNTLNQDIQKLF